MGRRKAGSGKPGFQDLAYLKKLRALIDSPSMKEAYKKLHPNVTDDTARTMGAKMMTPEIFDDIKKLMGLENCVVADKATLERLLFLVISRWINKEEKTADMISAVRELTKLVPEFKDRLQVEDITNASEEELDRKLRGFGYDPSIISEN